MKVLVIGGERSGEWVDVLDGAQAWVDIRTGDTFRIAHIDWAVQKPGEDGLIEVVERYRIRLAIHPEIAAVPGSGQIINQAVSNLAMTHFARAEGEPLELEPPKAPDTPAALYGPDGKPL